MIRPISTGIFRQLSAIALVPCFIFGCNRTTEEKPAQAVDEQSVAVGREPEPERVAEPVSSEWQSSDDGALSLRIISSRGEIPLGQGFFLTVELRNDSAEPLEVLRPDVELENFRHSHRRPTNLPLSRQLPEPGATSRSPDDAIVTLLPDETLRDDMLWRNEYWGSNQEGRWPPPKLEFEYHVDDSDRRQASELGHRRLWTGRIVSEPLELKRVLPGPEHAAEPAWSTSADGAVSFRLSAESRTVERTEPIVIVGEIRNDSSQTIRVFRPLLHLYAIFSNLVLVGPSGLLVYEGGAWDAAYGSESYVVLAPNGIASDRIELTGDDYKDFHVPGPVLIFLLYHSAPLWRAPEEHDWVGYITTHTIMVRRK